VIITENIAKMAMHVQAVDARQFFSSHMAWKWCYNWI